MKITKKEIQENKIFILNNVLSDIDKMVLWRMANDSPFKHGHKSDALTDEPQRRFTSHLNTEVMTSGEMVKKLIGLFKDPVKLNKVYINSADCATKTLAHCDNYDNAPSILIPMNQQWDRNWGGYTVFFKGMNSCEVAEAICPSPGQVIIFNGSMWHLALPPSMCAPCPRFMLALKLEYTETLRS